MGREDYKKEPEEEAEAAVIQRTTTTSPARPPLDSVPGEWRDRVGDLFDTWSDVCQRNQVLRGYYEMKNPIKNLGISTPLSLDRVNSVVGWCSKAVHARSVRSIFDGFVFAGESDPALDELVRRNRVRSLYQQACASALTYGVSAMSVMAGGGGQAPVVVRGYSANQFCVLWDKDAQRISCGVVLADVDRQGNPSRYVCHMPDAVLTLARDAGDTRSPWSCEVEGNPMGRPMMEVFVHDPDPDRPLGHSLLTPELLGIVDKAMRDVLRMEVGAEFFTFPQRYILGAAEDLFALPGDGSEAEGEAEVEGEVEAPPASPEQMLRAYVGSYLALTRDENGDVPQVGQFSPATADNFTRVFENDAQRFSGATNVPLSQLGVMSNNYTSSDALGAANDPLILEVEDMNRRNAESLETVARMMMAVRDGKRLDELDGRASGVQAYFRDPSMPTISARADGWTKIGASDNSIVGTDVWYENLGLPHATIERLKSQKGQAAATDSLNRIADAIEQRALPVVVGKNGS